MYILTHTLTLVLGRVTQMSCHCISTHACHLFVRTLSSHLLSFISPYLSYSLESSSWFIQYTLIYITICVLLFGTVYKLLL
ncbi:unnamed protein product [Hymenolepis diminuta]|uniref:Uncharacterized protein n=1 Tax=Hymenolepis diminuta TaxID=6216 RepID=A0A564YS34_HYMDI|nr:unnamed protein product [Hymenolepis diminuta]